MPVTPAPFHPAAALPLPGPPQVPEPSTDTADHLRRWREQLVAGGPRVDRAEQRLAEADAEVARHGARGKDGVDDQAAWAAARGEAQDAVARARHISDRARLWSAATRRMAEVAHEMAAMAGDPDARAARLSTLELRSDHEVFTLEEREREGARRLGEAPEDGARQFDLLHTRTLLEIARQRRQRLGTMREPGPTVPEAAREDATTVRPGSSGGRAADRPDARRTGAAGRLR